MFPKEAELWNAKQISIFYCCQMRTYNLLSSLTGPLFFLVYRIAKQTSKRPDAENPMYKLIYGETNMYLNYVTEFTNLYTHYLSFKSVHCQRHNTS